MRASTKKLPPTPHCQINDIKDFYSPLVSCRPFSCDLAMGLPPLGTGRIPLPSVPFLSSHVLCLLVSNSAKDDKQGGDLKVTLWTQAAVIQCLLSATNAEGAHKCSWWIEFGNDMMTMTTIDNGRWLNTQHKIVRPYFQFVETLLYVAGLAAGWHTGKRSSEANGLSWVLRPTKNHKFTSKIQIQKVQEQSKWTWSMWCDMWMKERRKPENSKHENENWFCGCFCDRIRAGNVDHCVALAHASAHCCHRGSFEEQKIQP